MTDNRTPQEPIDPNEVLPTTALRDLWAAQDDVVSVADEIALVDSLRETHRRENKLLRRLNIQEVIPAIVLGAFYFWNSTMTDARQWALLCAGVLAFGVAIFMVSSTLQQRAAESGFGHTMRGELHRSLAQMSHRAWLYRNVGWWYFAPIALGVVCARIAVMPLALRLADVIFFSLFAAFLGGLWFMNRRIGRTRYEPEVERYTALLADLDS